MMIQFTGYRHESLHQEEYLTPRQFLNIVEYDHNSMEEAIQSAVLEVIDDPDMAVSYDESGNDITLADLLQEADQYQRGTVMGWVIYMGAKVFRGHKKGG